MVGLNNKQLLNSTHNIHFTEINVRDIHGMHGRKRTILMSASIMAIKMTAYLKKVDIDDTINRFHTTGLFLYSLKTSFQWL